MYLIFESHGYFPLLDAVTSLRALRALLREYFLLQLSTQVALRAYSEQTQGVLSDQPCAP